MAISRAKKKSIPKLPKIRVDENGKRYFRIRKKKIYVKDNISERELIKFIIKKLAPKRRKYNRKKTEDKKKEGWKDINKSEPSMAINVPTTNPNDPIQLAYYAELVKQKIRQEPKTKLLEPPKEEAKQKKHEISDTDLSILNSLRREIDPQGNLMAWTPNLEEIIKKGVEDVKQQEERKRKKIEEEKINIEQQKRQVEKKAKEDTEQLKRLSQERNALYRRLQDAESNYNTAFQNAFKNPEEPWKNLNFKNLKMKMREIINQNPELSDEAISKKSKQKNLELQISRNEVFKKKFIEAYQNEINKSEKRIEDAKKAKDEIQSQLADIDAKLSIQPNTSQTPPPPPPPELDEIIQPIEVYIPKPKKESQPEVKEQKAGIQLDDIRKGLANLKPTPKREPYLKPEEERTPLRIALENAMEDRRKAVEGEATEEPKESKEQDGEGKRKLKGLSNYEIDTYMSHYPEYAMTIPRDGIRKYILPLARKGKPISFIMNTDKEGKRGKHWVAIHIDPKISKSIEYYDSFAEPVMSDILDDLMDLHVIISPKVLLKFKENKIVEQSATSDNCGYFAMHFLINRMTGKPFKEAKKISQVAQGEKEIKRFKKYIK